MKICGVGVCGPNERYLENTLDSFQSLCDEILIVGNNIDKKSKEIIRSRKIYLYENNSEWGKYQPKIKQELFELAATRFNPDWFLSLDMDESFGRNTTRKELENLTNTEEVGWYFWFIQKWNAENKFNPNLSFWDVRMFKNRKDLGYKLEDKPVHCGMAPRWAYEYGFYAPHIIIHRGLLNSSERKRKAERYEKYDSKQIFCSPEYYKWLNSNYDGIPLNENEEYEKVVKDVKSWAQRVVPKIIIKKMKYHKILRKIDGEILRGIPEENCFDYTSQGSGFDFQCLGEDVIEENHKEAPIVETTEKMSDNVCFVCGYSAKSAFGLQSHERKHGENRK